MAIVRYPRWPIETTILYFVSYYPTNQSGQAPTFVDTTMYNYNDAEARAKALITQNGNVGVAVITPTATTIIYPSIPFNPNAPN